jgi:hypothetical protein
VKGLRLTRRGEIVRDTVLVAAFAAGFFPAMSLIIGFFNSIGVQ